MEMKECEYCKRELPVFDPSTMEEKFYHMLKGIPDDELYVRLMEDPFDSEIYGNRSLHWLCQSCEHAAYMEI